nr:hypothetical protein [Orientia tsutsugamushi]
MFPITIAGFKVVSSSMPDTNASGRLICLCPNQGFQCLYLYSCWILGASTPCRCYKVTNVYGKSWRFVIWKCYSKRHER